LTDGTTWGHQAGWIRYARQRTEGLLVPVQLATRCEGEGFRGAGLLART